MYLLFVPTFSCKQICMKAGVSLNNNKKPK